SPLNSMRTPKGYARSATQRAPRNASRERESSATTAVINPPSQIRNVNTGNGSQGSLCRAASTVGLYTDRKSVRATSVTWTASARQRPNQAQPNRVALLRFTGGIPNQLIASVHRCTPRGSYEYF